MGGSMPSAPAIQYIQQPAVQYIQPEAPVPIAEAPDLVDPSQFNQPENTTGGTGKKYRSQNVTLLNDLGDSSGKSTTGG